MSLLPNDIQDDEIRIISSDKKHIETETQRLSPERPDTEEENLFSSEDYRSFLISKRKTLSTDISGSKRWNKWLLITDFLFIAALVVFFWWEIKRDILPEAKNHLQIVTTKSGNEVLKDNNINELISSGQQGALGKKGFVETFDTTVNKEKFTVFIPRNLTPQLRVGVNTLKDTAAVFVVQAADIRGDNGGIVGAYVYKGDLVSKGQAKAGFCAIIHGKPIIGVAESTPYLEQAIESDGYFFRQYPLVMEGQPVSNRLKYSSLRKALAELNGETVVIMSHNRMTLNDFAQYLVDIGVKNAIYLVGSSTFGFALDEEGNRIEFGEETENPSRNTNYLVWK